MTDVIEMPLMRPLTAADLADRPDDGHRYELLDEAAGTAAYWVLDPGEPPALTAWELRAGEYVQVASISGPEEFAAHVPFAVTVVPDDLIDPDFPVWATR